MSKIPELSELMKAGVHFGHQASKWHPKMAPFIFTAKNGIHVINLEETQKQLSEAAKFVTDLTLRGANILFLGTKKQAQKIVKDAAVSCGMPYVVSRWLGGTLTNASSILNLVKKYRRYVEERDNGKLSRYTKKEQLLIIREIANLEEVIGGISSLDKIPDAIFIVDIKEEKTAIAEAMVKKVPVVAICDTNVNPDKVAYPIAGNDDATSSIKILVEFIASVIKEAKDSIKK
jgi:small subunit ribosomal protein S2